MVKVVIGTKVCSFEEMLEEYSRVCEENEGLKKQISELEEKLSAEQEMKLPSLPIEVASMLINATIEYPTISLLKAFGAGETSVADKYSKSDLKEIAEHLLVYCNNSDEDSDTQN